MSREIVLAAVILASGVVTVALTIRSSPVLGLETLVLHLFMLVDVAIRPRIEGVGRETVWRAWWGKALMIALVYLPLGPWRAPSEALGPAAAGLGMTIAGAAVALAARLRLGRMGTSILATPDDATLCRDGVYRYVRHPIYSGFLLVFLGHQVAFVSVAGVLVWGLFVLTFIRVRIDVEERMLVERFGERYIGYRDQTWRLLPGIY
jgi:protein-S-isoprenylcysteine O-methyltransferase Ste14